jgi:hypothetical protein
MLEKCIRTVKGQLAYFDTQIRRWSRDPDRPGYDAHKLNKYKQLAYEFQDVLDYLLRQRRAEQGFPTSSSEETPAHEPTFELEADTQDFESEATPVQTPAQRTNSDVLPSDANDDLSDLPEELLRELSDSFKGETDPLIAIINARGGTASIDEILVDLYRKYKEVGKRPIISNKLYRFSRRGLCAAVPGRKGIYTTDPAIVQAGHEDDEDPDSEPSGSASNNDKGVAGSPERPSNPSPDGSTPSTSTHSKVRRELFASTAVPPLTFPKR